MAQPIVSGSGESCAGLDTALGNNLTFIADQRANPDAQSAGRIENRQAVVDLIQQRRTAAGRAEDVRAAPPAQTPAPPVENPVPPAQNPAPPTEIPACDVVCAGSLSGEDGAPAAAVVERVG